SMGLLAPGGGMHRGKEIVHVSSAGDNLGIKRLAVFADSGTSPVGVADFERNPDRCAWWRATPCQDVGDVDIEVDTKRVADGEHRFVVPARGPSRHLIVSYRSHLADPSPVATRSLTLEVSAGVRLAVRPRHVRNGQSITFAGSLLGRPVPRAGKLVDMQVRVGRRW